MSAYVPEDSQDGTSFVVSKTTDVSVINSFMVSGTNNRMIATAVTTVVEFRGLSRSDASGMAANADYNYIDKHGVRYTGNSSWMAMPDCEGTECRADARRSNEADMWRVTVTFISTTVTGPSGWTKETF